MKKILYLPIILLVSCVNEKKASNYYNNNKDKLAIKCAKEFPVKAIDVKTDTMYLPSGNIDYTKEIDTIVKLIKDTVKREIVKEKIVRLASNYKPCLPDTLRLFTIQTVKDSAAEYALKSLLYKETVKNKDLQEKVDRRGKTIWVLISICLFLVLAWLVTKWLKI